MQVGKYGLFVLFGVILTFTLFAPVPVHAGKNSGTEKAGSAFDVINAVNALRASYGQPPYSISPILMYTAQNQADFMAANQIVTHSGPGGIGVTDRLLAAGYPLAGDLSLGGFRSENITGGNESMSAEAAVNQWTGDAPHLTTMISSDLTEIGAGVAINSGRVYYVIDAARPTTSGAPQAVNTISVDGTGLPVNEAPIAVLLVSTPDSNGDVVHEVQFGQSLWQIAIAYEVKIDEIKQLNNLFDDSIYPGEKLLIKREFVAFTETPTILPLATDTITPTISSTLTATPTQLVAVTASEKNSPAPDNRLIMGVAIGIIALAVLVGIWFSRNVDGKGIN